MTNSCQTFPQHIGKILISISQVKILFFVDYRQTTVKSFMKKQGHLIKWLFVESRHGTVGEIGDLLKLQRVTVLSLL